MTVGVIVLTFLIKSRIGVANVLTAMFDRLTVDIIVLAFLIDVGWLVFVSDTMIDGLTAVGIVMTSRIDGLTDDSLIIRFWIVIAIDIKAFLMAVLLLIAGQSLLLHQLVILDGCADVQFLQLFLKVIQVLVGFLE